MFMGYIYITCSDCGREIKHHSSDVPTWTTRICPGCGKKLEVCTPEQDDGQTD